MQHQKERADSVERELKKFKESEGERSEKARADRMSSTSSSPSRRRRSGHDISASSQHAHDGEKLQAFRVAMGWGDLDLTDKQGGWTLLHHVCNGASPGGEQLLDSRKTDGVEFLDGLLVAFSALPKKVSVDLVSGPTTGLPKPIGWTPLRFLVNNKSENDNHRLTMIQMLVDFNADVETRIGAGGVCVLMSSAATSNTRAVELLIESCADAMAKNIKGSTLVDYTWNNKDMKEIFLARGVQKEVDLDGAGRHFLDAA